MWRFLKKIENEPVTLVQSEQEFLNQDDQNTITDYTPWILDLNSTYDDNNADSDAGMAMDMDSDLVTVVGDDDLNDSTCETMNIEQTSDVTSFLKRAIGAERRQKVSPDHFHSNETDHSNFHHVSSGSTYEETEQFFHDLCAELTNTTAALVSSSTSNALNFTSTPEQTLIH